MQSLYLARRIVAGAALGISIATLAACSSGSSSPPASSPSASSPSASSPSVTSSPAASASTGSAVSAGSSAAASQITSNWEAFFSGSTSGAKKISLLQNGEAFASVINAQAGSALSKSAAAKVVSVSVNSTGTQATVKYNVLLGGQSALSGQSGVAVYENGTWKVGDASFCALLALENSGKAPSVCSSAG